MIASIVILRANVGMYCRSGTKLFVFCSMAVDMQVVLSFAFYFRSCSCVCVLRCMKGTRTFQAFRTRRSWLWKLRRKAVENSNNWWIGEVIGVTCGHLGCVEKQAKFPSCWGILVMDLPEGIWCFERTLSIIRQNDEGPIIQHKARLDSSVF